MQTQVISFHDGLLPVTTLSNILCQLTRYADAHGIKDPELYRIEDNTHEDPVNQRFDVEILYKREQNTVSQKFLFLKGELIDGESFHKRFSEFYPHGGAYESN